MQHLILLCGKNFDTEIDNGRVVAKRRLQFGLSFRYRMNRIQKNNTAFDKTNKDRGYKGSAKMIVGGVCTKKYVIHATPINCALAMLLIK